MGTSVILQELQINTRLQSRASESHASSTSHKATHCSNPCNKLNTTFISHQNAKTPTSSSKNFQTQKEDEVQQPLDRTPQLHHLPHLSPNPRRWDLAQQPSQQHRLPQVPPMASHSHRSLDHGRLLGRLRRSLLPQHCSHVVLPLRHVLHHSCSDRLHHFRLRRDG